MTMKPEIQSLIAHCWSRGDSIGETIRTIERRHGHRLDFAEVHQHFIALSWGMAA